MNIKEISKEIYQNNVEKGFWDKPRNTGEMLMLVVSELSEALEADRKERYSQPGLSLQNGLELLTNDKYAESFKSLIKDSFEDEIADAVIRLFDISVGLGIDLEWHIKAKMRYNSTRPHKHGKSY
jgi:NTP pyrophosphatase (non-canonical NTP hydrolase)